MICRDPRPSPMQRSMMPRLSVLLEASRAADFDIDDEVPRDPHHTFRYDIVADGTRLRAHLASMATILFRISVDVTDIPPQLASRSSIALIDVRGVILRSSRSRLAALSRHALAPVSPSAASESSSITHHVEHSPLSLRLLSFDARTTATCMPPSVAGRRRGAPTDRLGMLPPAQWPDLQVLARAAPQPGAAPCVHSPSVRSPALDKLLERSAKPSAPRDVSRRPSHRLPSGRATSHSSSAGSPSQASAPRSRSA